MKVCRIYYLILLCAIVVTSCIESYPPPIINEEVNFLVIDGSVNTEDGSAQVKLSHAIPLSSNESFPPELNASVRLEDNDGNVYTLIETTAGNYAQSNLTLNPTKEYRLYVRTSNNTEYLSDFVTIKQTPPIDSINWAPSRTIEGIDILVNTHDDTKNTRYYQWTFEETFQYEAPYYTFLKYENGEVTSIPNEEQIFRCWRTLPSQKILIGSSEKLMQDIIYNFPITFIPKDSQKKIIKYSILVQQKALTREAYDYWLNLQKTTENLGGLFDPQPGRVTGNIHNISKPNAPVLGYFDVGAAQEKRFFLNASDLPEDLRNYKSYRNCAKDTVLVENLSELTISDLIIDPLYGQGPTPYAYTFSNLICTDCRQQGGVTTKPPFWE